MDTADEMRRRMETWILRVVDVDGREIMRAPAMLVAPLEGGLAACDSTPMDSGLMLSQIATVELGPEDAMSSAPIATDPALFTFGDLAIKGIRVSLHRGMVAFDGDTETHRSTSYTTPLPAPTRLP